jgi:hypothetical protein
MNFIKCIALSSLSLSLSSCGLFKKQKGSIPYASLSAPVMPVWLTGDTTTIANGDIFPGKCVNLYVNPNHEQIKESENLLTVLSYNNIPELKIVCPSRTDNGVLFDIPL